jgi:pantothenate kinase, type III
MVCEDTVEELTFENIQYYQQRYSIQQGILSTVKPLSAFLLSQTAKTMRCFINLDYSTPVPIRIAYSTPSTLGCDRVAAMVGASEQINEEAVIVIDAGTAITYDLMNEEKVYLGGNIAPGMRLRLRSLHEYTGKLPLVESEGELPEIGNSTTTAIRCGVVRGICYEIESFISDIRSIHPSVLVFLTGGDANFLLKN